jgi:SAM-dependent methyltransferase
LKSKSTLQHLKDFAAAPLRMLFLPDQVSQRLGLTSLEDERLTAVRPWITGALLDVGAGTNRLVREYGSGVGVDVHDFGGDTLLVSDTRHLPFPDGSFDTVTFVACLNHIPERREALAESRRVLRDGGRIAVTMIDPILSAIGHRIWWYSEDRHRGGMRPGEVYGLWPRTVRRLLEDAGFELIAERRFLYGLNRLYVGRKLSWQPPTHAPESPESTE